MNKAEDFEKTLPISSRGQAGLNRYDFAEAYHQSEFKKRVNAISDEVKIAQWLKEKGYDRKEYQQLSNVISKYLELLKY